MLVGAENVAPPLPQHGALEYLGSLIEMTKMETLMEVMHQVYEAKFHQQDGDKLATWVLGLIQVHVDIY